MTSSIVTQPTRTVTPDQWRDAVVEAAGEHRFLHSIGAVDELGRADEIRIVARLINFDATPPTALTIETSVPRDGGQLASLIESLPGAQWYEREIRDFFGVEFVNGDPTPLLNHNPEIFPLRKDFVLAARAGVAWPGAKEPGESDGAGSANRRRMAPTGVPDPEVWGQRPANEPPATPDEIAASLAGGRVRRRR